MVALVKVIVSMVWAIVIAVNLTMGVAWHRFLAFFNIYFKREADGGVALGALKPMMSGGQPLDFEKADPEKDDVRRRQDRGLLLEGLAGLFHLHRMRPMPVAVPGLEHR